MSLYIGRKNNGKPLLHLTNNPKTEAEMKTGNTFSDTLFHSDVPFLGLVDIIDITEFNDAGMTELAGIPNVTDPDTVARLDYYFNNGYLFDVSIVTVIPAGNYASYTGDSRPPQGTELTTHKLEVIPVLGGGPVVVKPQGSVTNRSVYSGPPPAYDNLKSSVTVPSSEYNITNLSSNLVRTGDIYLRYAQDNNYVNEAGTIQGAPSLSTNWRNLTCRLYKGTNVDGSTVGPYSFPKEGSDQYVRLKMQIYIFNLKKASSGDTYEFGSTYNSDYSVKVSREEMTLGGKSIKDMSFAFAGPNYFSGPNYNILYPNANPLVKELILGHYNRSVHDWWYNIYPSCEFTMSIIPGNLNSCGSATKRLDIRVAYKYPTLTVGDTLTFSMTPTEIAMSDQSGHSISIAKVGAGRRLRKNHPEFQILLPGANNVTPPMLRQGASSYTQPPSPTVIVGATTYTKEEVVANLPIPDEFINTNKMCHVSAGKVHGNLRINSYGMYKYMDFSNLVSNTGLLNFSLNLPQQELAGWYFHVEQNMRYFNFHSAHSFNGGNVGDVSVVYYGKVVGNVYQITRKTVSKLSSYKYRYGVIVGNLVYYYDEEQWGVADNQLTISYPDVSFNLLLLGVEDR